MFRSIALAALSFVPGPDSGAGGADAALAALFDGGRDLAAARAAVGPDGALFVVVVGDRLGGDSEALTLQERHVAGVILADPRVRAALPEGARVVLQSADPEALRSVAARRIVDDRDELIPSADKPLLGLTPPALARVDADGRVVAALERLAPVEAASVAAWLAQGARPADDDASRAYHAAAVSVGEEAQLGLAALAERVPAWSTKARARIARPEEFAAYELLRAPQVARAEFSLIDEAKLRLLEAQLADGSFAGSAATRAEDATAFAALALHRTGAHDAAQRATEWLTAQGVVGSGVRDPLRGVLWLDIQLARYSAGWSRTEDVQAAVDALSAAALDGGGWAARWPAGAAYGAEWTTAEVDAVASVHTGFALEALARAKAEGLTVDEALLTRGTVALRGLRAADGAYTDLPASMSAESSGGMRALALAGEAALVRLDGLQRKPALAAIDAYLAELAAQRATECMGAVGRRPARETGETRTLGWLAYTRLTEAVPRRQLLRRDGRFRRMLTMTAGHDSTWLDTLEQGWVLPTAIALTAFEVTR